MGEVRHEKQTELAGLSQREVASAGKGEPGRAASAGGEIKNIWTKRLSSDGCFLITMMYDGRIGKVRRMGGGRTTLV